MWAAGVAEAVVEEVAVAVQMDGEWLYVHERTEGGVVLLVFCILSCIGMC